MGRRCSPLWPRCCALLLCGLCHLERADWGQLQRGPHCCPPWREWLCPSRASSLRWMPRTSAVGGGGTGTHLVDAQHRALEGAAQPAQSGPQGLQTPGPGDRGRSIKLTAEWGGHGVDDHQTGHPPRQKHGHLLSHTLQQGVLEAEGGGVTARAVGVSPAALCRGTPHTPIPLLLKSGGADSTWGQHCDQAFLPPWPPARH